MPFRLTTVVGTTINVFSGIHYFESSPPRLYVEYLNPLSAEDLKHLSDAGVEVLSDDRAYFPFDSMTIEPEPSEKSLAQ